MYLAAADIPAGTAAPSRTGIFNVIRDAHAIVPVSNATEQAQAVADWPTASGAAISAANPVIVHRQDLDAINISENGTTWETYYGGDSGWVAGSLSSGFTGNLWVRRVGQLVEVSGGITGTFPDGAATQFGTVPVGYRPDTTAGKSNARLAAFLTGTYEGSGYVDGSGVIGIINRSGGSRAGCQIRGTYLLG